jgi:hypothetical protein
VNLSSEKMFQNFAFSNSTCAATLRSGAAPSLGTPPAPAGSSRALAANAGAGGSGGYAGAAGGPSDYAAGIGNAAGNGAGGGRGVSYPVLAM